MAARLLASDEFRCAKPVTIMNAPRSSFFERAVRIVFALRLNALPFAEYVTSRGIGSVDVVGGDGGGVATGGAGGAGAVPPPPEPPLPPPPPPPPEPPPVDAWGVTSFDGLENGLVPAAFVAAT